MTQRRGLIMVAAIALIVGACDQAAETTTTPPQTTQTIEASEPAVTATTSTTTTHTTPAATITTQQPPDPWEIDVVPVNDYEGVDMTFAIEEIIRNDAWIEATIVSIGDPETERWCCLWRSCRGLCGLVARTYDESDRGQHDEPALLGHA